MDRAAASLIGCGSKRSDVEVDFSGLSPAFPLEFQSALRRAIKILSHLSPCQTWNRLTQGGEEGDVFENTKVSLSRRLVEAYGKDGT